MLRYEAIQLPVEMCDSLDFLPSATQISLDENGKNQETEIKIQIECGNDQKTILKEFAEKKGFRFEEKPNNVVLIF